MFSFIRVAVVTVSLHSNKTLSKKLWNGLRKKISVCTDIHQDQYFGKYSFLHRLSYTSNSISKTTIFIPSLSFSSFNILKWSRFGLSIESHLRRDEHVTKPGISIDHKLSSCPEDCTWVVRERGLFRQGMLLSQVTLPLAWGNKCNTKKDAETKQGERRTRSVVWQNFSWGDTTYISRQTKLRISNKVQLGETVSFSFFGWYIYRNMNKT